MWPLIFSCIQNKFDLIISSGSSLRQTLAGNLDHGDVEGKGQVSVLDFSSVCKFS